MEYVPYNQILHLIPVISVFVPNDALQVFQLQHIHYQHGKQYEMVKEIGKDGQQNMGQLSESSYNLDEIALHYFQEEGMSLLMNIIQNRWSWISTFAKLTEEEVSGIAVNAHLSMRWEKA